MHQSIESNSEVFLKDLVVMPLVQYTHSLQNMMSNLSSKNNLKSPEINILHSECYILTNLRYVFEYLMSK